MQVIIGNTGLIGKTLCEKEQFDMMFNSKNIQDFELLCPDNCDLYLCCLPAEKWKINLNPFDDIKNIINIVNIIRNKKFNNIYLFSTIDVYSGSLPMSNESTTPPVLSLDYGSNRRMFEIIVGKELTFNSLKIIRLPGLYGKYIKKNILFDILNDNNLDKININSSYQWYNLEDLSQDLSIIKDSKDNIFNLFPEPVNTSDILSSIGVGELGFFGEPIRYNFCTDKKKSGYWNTKEYVISNIERFFNENRS